MTPLDKFQSFIQKVIPTATKDDIEALSSKAKTKEFQKGEIFVKEEEVCDELLFLHQGLFRYYILHDGDDITKDFAVDIQNPFCTAYTSFTLQKPSEIWIESLEHSQVLVWNKRDILPLFQDHPFWLRFSKAMVEKLFYRKEKREIELLKCSAEVRYQNFLVDFPGITQRVQQYHIASYLGITPESLSRIRSKRVKGA